MARRNRKIRTEAKAGSSPARWFLYGGLLFLAIAAGYIAYNYTFLRGQMDVGTAYGARVACSCHYVGGRSLEDCEKDFEPGMEMIGLSLDEDARRVTASVPLLQSATAEFREGWGCIMLTEDESKN